ncbi:MAG: putative transposase [Actinomycetota bacterium]|nr:putative transposase [Actinomycetota bacterium]
MVSRVKELTEGLHQVEHRPVSSRDWNDAHLADAAREIHADDPTFGYRFIATNSTQNTASEQARPGAASLHLTGFSRSLPESGEGPSDRTGGP